MQIVRMRAPIGNALDYYSLNTLMTVRSDAALMECSASVDNGNLVTGAVSQHPYTVS